MKYTGVRCDRRLGGMVDLIVGFDTLASSLGNLNDRRAPHTPLEQYHSPY